MKLLYIIQYIKENKIEKTVFYDNYGKARKDAIRTVCRRNTLIESKKKTYIHNGFHILEEIAPDKWTNGFETITISISGVK